MIMPRASKKLWELFGKDFLNGIFINYSFWYRFDLKGSYRRRRAVDAAKAWNDDKEILHEVIDVNSLIGDTFKDTVYNVMEWVNYTYPSKEFYRHDKVYDKWNTPLETINKMNLINAGEDVDGVDCDDYALLIYGLCRAAGVPADCLRLCFMETRTEWHLNVMFLDIISERGIVPYTIEGTYYPSTAMKNFGNIPYMQNTMTSYNPKTRKFFTVEYYEVIAYQFNEIQSWKNKYFTLF